MKRQTVVYVLTLVFSVLYLVVAGNIALADGSIFGGDTSVETMRAKVLRITDVQQETYSLDEETPQTMTYVYFEARLLSGDNRGQTVSAVQEIDSMFAFSAKQTSEGDIVLVERSVLYGDDSLYMSDYSRTGPLLYLGLLFCLLLLIFGRKKGLDTILSLLFTCLAVFVVLLPAILNGQNIYIWAIVTCTFISVMTLLLISGANRKSLAAACGCIGGILVTAALVKLMEGPLKITGLLEEESVYLATLNQENPIDLKAILFAMILVGAMGAILDVAVSIASSLLEIRQQSPQISTRELFASSTAISRDIMGTMVNTLVLAYIGSAMTGVLLLFAFNSNVLQIVNREMIAVEILQALIGSLSMLLVLPLTSTISVLLFTRKGKVRK